jgi:hypothetical protein
VLNFMAGPKVFGSLTYLFMKQGSLFCFVLFWRDGISRTTPDCFMPMLFGIFRKLLMSRGAPKIWFEDCLELQRGSY